MNIHLSRDTKFCLLLLACAAILFGSCLNGRWSPGGGDDAYYLATARSLARGEGYAWNGYPVQTVPPGWPLLLAGVLRISPTFWAVQATAAVLLTIAAGLWYGVLRAFTTSGRALAVMLLTLVLFEWHRFSYSAYSEPLFFATFGGAMLMAVRFGQNRGTWWRGLLLVFCCTAMVWTRYCGTLMLAVVLAVALAGRLRPRWQAPWTAAALALVVTAGVFWCTYFRLSALARTAVRADDPQYRLKMELKGSTHGKTATGKLHWPVDAGGWLTGLLWPPAAAMASNQAVLWLSRVAGTVLLVPLGFLAVRGLRRREWVWPALLAILVVMLVRWTPVPRYIAPLAPLILLGIWEGTRALAEKWPLRAAQGDVPHPAAAWPQRIATVLIVLVLGSAAVVNLGIVAAACWVHRSPRFGHLCLAGEYEQTLQVAQALRDLGVGDYAAVVAAQYDDPKRSRPGAWGRRALVLATDLNLGACPEKYADPKRAADLHQWALQWAIQYLIIRPGDAPRRAWHVRLSSAETARYYVLMKVEEQGLRPVPLPKPVPSLSRVPGL